MYDQEGYYTNDTVDLTVLPDTTAPIIDSPADISYEEGTTGHSISWTNVDFNPGNYSITRDGIVVASGFWTSGIAIIIDVDGLSIGSYNYTLIVTDLSPYDATDTVIVTVTAATTTTTSSEVENIYFDSVLLSVVVIGVLLSSKRKGRG